MLPTKTPASSLSGAHTTHLLPPHLTTITVTTIELLAKRVWYRTLPKIWRMRSVSPPTTRLPPAIELPQETVEMIIAHLIYDTPSLLACS